MQDQIYGDNGQFTECPTSSAPCGYERAFGVVMPALNDLCIIFYHNLSISCLNLKTSM
jgi:hypothetical protein